MRTRPMSRHRGTTAVLLVLILLPLLAQAGMLDKLFGKDKKTAYDPVRYDRHPPLEFSAGAIQYGVWSKWRIGHLPIDVTDETIVLQSGRTLEIENLAIGQRVLVTGTRRADGVVEATRISVLGSPLRPNELNGVEVTRPAVGEVAARAPR